MSSATIPVDEYAAALSAAKTEGEDRTIRALFATVDGPITLKLLGYREPKTFNTAQQLLAFMRRETVL